MYFFFKFVTDNPPLVFLASGQKGGLSVGNATDPIQCDGMYSDIIDMTRVSMMVILMDPLWDYGYDMTWVQKMEMS